MKKILLAIGIAAIAAACGNPAAHADRKVTVEKISGDDTPASFWHGRVDGIECIVVINESADNSGDNGISCNWKPQ